MESGWALLSVRFVWFKISVGDKGTDGLSYQVAQMWTEKIRERWGLDSCQRSNILT